MKTMTVDSVVLKRIPYNRQIASVLFELQPGEAVRQRDLGQECTQRFGGSPRAWYTRISVLFGAGEPRLSYLKNFKKGLSADGYAAVARVD